MNQLWIEPSGGLAGDMLLAALLDLGDPAFGLSDLRALADELVPGECELQLEAVMRGGLRCSALHVRTPESVDPPHRHLSDLLALLERAGLDEKARAGAEDALVRLGKAEARVHDVPLDAVHFHEIGAVDTLIDVAGAALAFSRLGITRVYASPPYVGEGEVACAHGTMPVPAPATAELLRGHSFRCGPGGERLTPTAAALLTSFVPVFAAPAGFLSTRIGYGAGRRDPDEGPPNLARVQLGPVEAVEAADVRQGRVELCEFNLDDATGEEVGFLLGELRRAGALEVWSTPVQMKKDRPGSVVSCLVRPGAREPLAEVILRHSPTLGMRFATWERIECQRETLVVSLEGREVRVKRRLRHHGSGAGSDSGEAWDLSPEFDDLAGLARELGLSLRGLERRACELAREELARRQAE